MCVLVALGQMDGSGRNTFQLPVIVEINRAFPTRVELLMPPPPRTPPPHTHIGFLLSLPVRLHRKRMESLNQSVAAVLTACCCVYTCSPGMLKSSGMGDVLPHPRPEACLTILRLAGCVMCNYDCLAHL